MSDKKENTGDWNTGDRNTGDRNTGDRNTGDWNTGDWNTGYRNTGDRNTGDRNTGDRNTGDWNTGYRNTGDWNTGYRNTGDRNTGDRNTGDWNTGDRNTGYLNTTEPTARLFNKDSGLSFNNISFPNFFYFELSEWIYGCDMTDEEKTANPSYECVDGYLKAHDYQEAWKASWDKADEEDKAKLFKLPNFDAGIFKEISGIDVEAKNEPTVNIGGVDYLACDIEKALKDIKPV